MSSELESDVCYHVYGWRHLVKAAKVTTGLAESNDSLYRRVDGCGLTACTPGSASGPTLGNEYAKTLPLSKNRKPLFYFYSFISYQSPLRPRQR